MSDSEWRKHVCERLREGSARMDCLETGLGANTALTQKISEDTTDLVEMFKALKGGLKVLGWFGTVAKWIGGIAVAVASVYAAWQALVKMFSR
jgi:hypothetical protein